MRPRQIAYIIWIIIALLGIASCLVPTGGLKIGKKTILWPTLSEALEINNHEHSATLDSTMLMIVDSIKNTTTKTHTIDTIHLKTNNILPTIAISDVDTRIYLSAFYQALDSSQQIPIRVVHYGDSQIEEDRISHVLREQWQSSYGGGGPGLIPLHQTIPTRTIRQWLSMDGIVQTTKEGPKRYIVYGPKHMRLNNNQYGVMGQVAIMDTSLVKNSEKVVMNIEPIDRKRKPHNYYNQIRLLSNGIYGYVYAQDTIIRIANNEPTTLPDSTTRCEIHLNGKGSVYGISLETHTGVIVDNIPMRGCSGNIFTRIDSTALRNFYYNTNTRLIIMQFGGNIIPATDEPDIINRYVKTLRQQVRYIRQCAPQASILFIGPSDMSTRINGVMTTYPLVPYLDRLLTKMAEEEKIGYWSMYHAMGGKNSMVAWHQKGLAGSDHVHFTRTGARKVGHLLYDWINEGKNTAISN